MARPHTPLLAVDIIIELPDQAGSGSGAESGGIPIVLIERRNPPHGWALPGGFVDVGEPLEVAAVREAREETCLEVQLRCLLGCYSDPARDPRGHTVSAVYIARASGSPRAADDARHLELYLPAAPPSPLAFDHALILADYRRFLATGEPAPLRHV